MRHTNFDYFKGWIINLIHQIEILRISTRYDFAYLDANQWEELILNYLLNLQIFDIHHTYSVHNDNLRLNIFMIYRIIQL
jgi:hypothetical protein